tara:strand:- start:172 stop:327 length:156 start_codon:yes stop_codon:yes gene_type:complete
MNGFDKDSRKQRQNNDPQYREICGSDSFCDGASAITGCNRCHLAVKADFPS